MDNQQAFDMLSELESFFFYKKTYEDSKLKEIHDKLEFCLRKWAEYSGCHN